MNSLIKIDEHLKYTFDRITIDHIKSIVESESSVRYIWKETRFYPKGILVDIKDDGELRHVHARGTVYRVRVNKGELAKVYISEPNKDGDVLPGWFGRVKRQLRKRGVPLSHETANKLFVAVLPYFK